jgi:hypothetical protein
MPCLQAHALLDRCAPVQHAGVAVHPGLATKLDLSLKQPPMVVEFFFLHPGRPALSWQARLACWLLASCDMCRNVARLLEAGRCQASACDASHPARASLPGCWCCGRLPVTAMTIRPFSHTAGPASMHAADHSGRGLVEGAGVSWVAGGLVPSPCLMLSFDPGPAAASSPRVLRPM